MNTNNLLLGDGPPDFAFRLIVYLRPDRLNGPMSPSCAIHNPMLRKLNQTSPKGQDKKFL